MFRFFANTAIGDGYNELSPLSVGGTYTFTCDADSVTTRKCTIIDPVGGAYPVSTPPATFTSTGWRNGPHTGTIEAATWSLAYMLSGTSALIQGTLNARFWKSVNATGASATQVGNTFTDTITIPNAFTILDRAINVAMPQVTLSNEYLFVEMWWNTTTAVVGRYIYVFLCNDYPPVVDAYIESPGIVIVATHTPSGGIICGATPSPTGVAVLSSFGAILGGGIETFQGIAYISAGGFLMSDARHYTVQQSCTGGAVVGGSSLVAGQYNTIVDDVAGGDVLGGASQVSAFNVQIVTQTPTGGAVAGDTTTSSGINVQVGAHYVYGGSVTGGVSTYHQGATLLSAGGSIAGGVSRYAVRCSHNVSGGAVAGGAAIFPPPAANYLHFAKRPVPLNNLHRIE